MTPALLLDAAERFGTPLYVYDAGTVQARCRALTEALRGLPARVLYAAKANAAPALLRLIAAEGLGFDAVSPGEVAVLRALGVPPGDILFTTTSTSDDELRWATEQGVLLNLDDAERVARLGALAPGAEVCVRVNPGVGAGHHRHVVTGGKESKFGIRPEDVPAVAETAARTGLRVVGLHLHIGSGVDDPAVLREAAGALLDAAPHFPALRFVNLGGGLPVPYRPGEAPFDPARLRDEVAVPVLERLHATHPGTEVWFEPGRFVVAEAGVLLARVHTVKPADGRVFVGTDSGFNHLIRPTLYGAYHALSNVSNPDGPLRTYDIVGNVCESGDLFARARRVQEVRRGDVLAIHDTGAYGAAMASTYNLRPLPAEALVGPDGTLRLTRARLSPEALAAEWLAAEEPVLEPAP
ncbi:MAG: diaminopimelate decarboxylase [Rubricoccaceae bacterium]